MKHFFLILRTTTVFVCIVLISFFLLFSFHPRSEVQVEVADFLHSGQGQLPFGTYENEHMYDVFIILSVLRILGAIALLYTLHIIPSLTRSELFFIGWMCVVIPGILTILPWDNVFTGMHLLLFPQGNWQFPATSFLIQTYPERFFMLFAAIWASVIILVGAGIVYGARKKHSTRKNTYVL